MVTSSPSFQHAVKRPGSPIDGDGLVRLKRFRALASHLHDSNTYGCCAGTASPVTMNCIAWNCRGLGKDPIVQALEILISQQVP